MTETIALHVTVIGRVQGVWYRGWAIEQARARSLTGWVRNRFDGSVEAVFCGPAAQAADMAAACRQGPPAAFVTAVEIKDFPQTDFPDFQRRPTA